WGGAGVEIGLSGAGASIRRGYPFRRPASDSRDGERSPPLYVARRCVLRSSGEAAAVGRSPGGGSVSGGTEQPGVSAHRQPIDRDAHPRIHGVAAPGGPTRLGDNPVTEEEPTHAQVQGVPHVSG